MIRPTEKYVAATRIVREKSPGGIILPIDGLGDDVLQFSKVVAVSSNEKDYSVGEIIIHQKAYNSRYINIDQQEVVMIHKDEIVGVTNEATCTNPASL